MQGNTNWKMIRTFARTKRFYGIWSFQEESPQGKVYIRCFDIESHKQVFNIKFSVLHLLLGLAGFLIVVVTSVVLTVIYTPLRELVRVIPMHRPGR